MKSPFLFLLYPALGLLAGWISMKARPAGDPRSEAGRSTSSRSPEKKESRPIWNGDDFLKAAMARTGEFLDPTSTPLKILLSDWTDAEVRAALDEALGDPDTIINGGGSAGLLLREYMRRDFPAALEWFSGISAIHRASLALTLSHAWPEGRAKEGLDFIRQNKELFGGSYATAWSIISKGMAGEATRGPEAVVSFLKQLHAEGFGADFGNPVAFPKGFDFAGLLGSEDFRNLNLQELESSVITSWRAQNRDAAFDWVVENGNAKNLRSMAAYREDSSPEMTAWLVKNLHQTTPEQRSLLLESKFMEWTDNTGADALRWIEMASTPALKEEFRTVAAQGLYFARPGPALEVIEAIPRTEDRLTFMETLAASTRPRSTPVPLTPENEKIIRSKLAEWGSDPARTEAIINRYKNPAKP